MSERPFFPRLLNGVTVVSSSLLLGSFFNHWLIDYNVIWVQPGTLSDSTIRAALEYYTTVFQCQPWYTTYLSVLAGAAILSTGVRVLMNGASGMLFDGASFLLLVSAFAMYLTNVQAALVFLPLGAELPATLDVTVREALQSLAASNMIISVSLTGILYLQAAQGYSEKPQATDAVRNDVQPLTAPSTPNPNSPALGAGSASKKKAA